MGGKITWGYVIREEACPRCGKMFCPTPMWALKFRGKEVCSVSCLRALEREAEQRKAPRPAAALEQYLPDSRRPDRIKIRPERREAIFAAVLAGVPYREIAERFSCVPSTVSQIARDGGIRRRRGPKSAGTRAE